MKKNRQALRIALSIVCAIIMIAVAVGDYFAYANATIITQFMNDESYTVETVEDTEIDTNYFKSDYTSLEALVADETVFAEQIQAEGTVLLQNKGLPLSEGSSVTFIGYGSSKSNFLLGGGGSGSISTENAPSLKDVFEENNFNVNSAVWSYYEQNSSEETAASDMSISSFSGYTDAAIVIISREGNEGDDVALVSTDDATKHDLELTDKEIGLIDMAVENFDNVVILLNTMNPMELGTIVDKNVSILWVGGGGEQGLRGIPGVLNGTYNPSGRLVDTYAFDNLSSPAIINFGNFSFTNTSDYERASAYYNYAENIYVGYKYYETRYADTIMGRANVGEYDYANQILYPYGYGLSYTNFAYSDYSMEETEDSFVLSVTVTNTGEYAGKEVVELYMQSPYTQYDIDNRIEKSSIQLVAFEKTDILQPGESETVSTTISKEEMRCYDAYGYGTYIVEAGDYYFTVGSNAHDALNNVLAAQGYTTANGMTYDGNSALVSTYTQDASDIDTYSYGEDGEKITNQFGSDTYTNYDSTFVYLTRNDWVGTWPTPLGGDDKSMEATAKMLEDIAVIIPEDSTVEMPTTGVKNGLSLVSMLGVPYDSDMWDTFLDQLTAQDMMYMIGTSGYGSPLIETIAKPFVGDKDGPAGISATLIGGAGAFGYPIEMLLASTWNVELAESMGTFIGEDAMVTGVSGWYAPSMNLHRTPFSGRNFEYYSEDPLQSGIFGSAVVAAAEAKGVYCYIKHFALNDQETNRSTAITFATEQTIRENCLRPFEISVRKGGASALMVSMNRVGCTWSGAHKGLVTNVLRNEWGFVGCVITDTAASYNLPMNVVSGMNAGTDLWLCTTNGAWDVDGYESNAYVVSLLRKASHNALYVMVNSNAVNGLSSSTRIVPITPAWAYQLIALNVLIFVGGFLMIFLTIRKLRKSSIAIEEK